jgi:pentatricopeptide repeat protein
VGALNACASVLALEEGRCVHQEIIQHGLESDVFVESSLVDMYAKCGSLEDAWSVFNKMPARNVVTWTAMILGHMQCGQGQKALGLFQEMKQEGVDPNSVTSVYLPLKRAGVFIRKSFERKPFMALKMVFVLAWTTVDSSNVSCQSLYHVLSGYSSMSSGSVTRSKLISVIRGQMSIDNLVISVVHFIPPPICISYTNSGE